MREIRFRGKREYNKEWVFGSLVTGLKGYSSIYYNPKGINTDSQNVFEHVSIDPETIGQYTGFEFEDVPIFENDILQCLDIGGLPIEGNSINTVVEFIEGAFVVYDQNKFALLLSEIIELDSINAILGNKFDNPELLK